MSRRQGFTLLELLVVIAIIGILISIFSVNLIRSIRTAELREAATQVATDLRRARSQAQRGSTAVQLSLPGTTASTSYTFTSQPRTLPNGVSLVCKTNCSASAVTVTYSAPYGELGATGRVFTVRSPVSTITPYEIRIVGVTGKVILTRAS